MTAKGTPKNNDWLTDTCLSVLHTKDEKNKNRNTIVATFERDDGTQYTLNFPDQDRCTSANEAKSYAIPTSRYGNLVESKVNTLNRNKFTFGGTYEDPDTKKRTYVTFKSWYNVFIASGVTPSQGQTTIAKAPGRAGHEGVYNKVSENGTGFQQAKNPLYGSFDKVSPDDMETASEMLDKLTRISDGRRVQPLSYWDKVPYKHRSWYDGYNLQIGDVWFMIPPEFILITSESNTNKLVTLRQENTQKTKAGYHRRTILIDLVAHGLNQINGFCVKGPDGDYYVDGVRPLLAQFKRTPFLPIFNELINCTYGIHTVALQSITIRTQEGFPNLMAVQITLQEVNMMPYIEMHSIYFQHMIDWDLFRYYYQSALTEEHEYKKLQSISTNFDKTRFKLSALSPTVFDNYKEQYDSKNKKFLDIVTDNENYDVWVDSAVDSFSVLEFDCNYSNMLANIQMSEADGPTLQFMGGMDTIYNVVIETKDYSVVQRLEQGRVNNDLLTRSNPKLRSLGFAKLESELVEFTGSLFVMIDTVVTNTVPGFPGLYHVQMTCVAYDIGQSEREQLHGFVPFNSENAVSQCIHQAQSGTYTKIKQDLYAEAKIRATMEVYPDMHLPTYSEVDSFIEKCSKFRAENNLSTLPYTTYPRRPVNSFYGVGEHSNVTPPGDIFVPSDVDTSGLVYNGYVDPDFYVFYAMPYVELLKSMDENGYKPTVRTTTKTSYNDSPVSSMVSGAFSGIISDVVTDAVYTLASTGAVLTGSSTIFQDLKNPNTMTVSKMDDIIKKCAPSDSPFIGKGDIFVKAGKESGLDPVYLFAHASLESGYGKSNIAKKYYNYYGIGAFDSNPSNAKNYSHKSLEEGIVNGAKWIANNYYNGTYHQTTLYKMRFNGGKHQYATDENWADKIASIMDKANGKKINKVTVNTTGASVTSATDSPYTMTQGQFNRICQAICNETEGETISNDSVERAVAQLVFDKFVSGKYQSIDAILNSSVFNKTTTNAPLTSTIKDNVRKVFCDGHRWTSYEICDMLAIDGERSNTSSYQTRNEIYESVGVAGNHSFYGNRSSNSNKDIKFTIVAGDDSSTSSDIATSSTVTSAKIEYKKSTVKKFAEPLITKTSKLIYGASESFVLNKWDTTLNIFNSSFVDMYQFSARGRLVRAFPAYLFCILDDQAQWYDGRKLWTNYYVYKSVVDIQVHETNDMPTATAVVTITNSVHNLDRTQTGLANYTIKNDPEYFNGVLGNWSKSFYNWSGLLIGGIKITDKLIELHQKIYDHARLREGARIHLRMGYGSDPFSLAPMINGHISDITLGDQITMVVTSDGHETIQAITSSKAKDVNNGAFGLFGLFDTQEASNMIAKTLVERSSWLNRLFENWFEAQKYGIEHFGNFHHEDAWLLSGISSETSALANAIFKGKWNELHVEARKQWDILKNIYIANYKPYLYCVGGPFIIGNDGEYNFSFNKYNMTPWDLFQICAQQAPEYIVKPIKHQFDSRIFFGLPAFLERYRYDFFGGEPSQKITTTTTSTAGTTISGDKESGDGKFVGQYYHSGIQPPTSKGTGIKSATIRIAFDSGHRNPKCTDHLKIYGIGPSGTKIELNSKKGNFADGKTYTCTVSGPILETIEQLEFEAYSPHDKEHNTNHRACCENAQLIEWEIVYEDDITTPSEETVVTTEETDYSDILYEECKTAAQAHYINSLTEIIDNQVRVTNKYSNTNIKCMYTLGSNVKSTPILHSDDSIDTSYQKTIITDTPITQNAFGPDDIYEFFSIYEIGRKSAIRVGISTLLYGWQQQYQGELILFGSPGMKPHDYLLVNDTYSNLYGVSIIREVCHSFNSSSGYTTSVTPGMIAFETKHHSGVICHVQNLLATLNCFSALTTSRLGHVKYIQQNIGAYSELELSMRKIINNMAFREKWNTIEDWGGLATSLGGTALAATALYKIGSITGAAKLVSSVFGTLKVTPGIAAKLGAIASKGRAGLEALKGIEGFSASNPIGWVVLIAMFAVEKMIGAVLDYISNKNVVTLFPLLWENYPFVSGVKDGERILAIDSNSNATNDNTKGQGHENTSWTDGSDDNKDIDY